MIANVLQTKQLLRNDGKNFIVVLLILLLPKVNEKISSNDELLR